MIGTIAVAASGMKTASSAAAETDTNGISQKFNLVS
jgi:hypothetical protein